MKYLQEARVPHFDFLLEARVRKVAPLNVSKYIFAFYNNKVMVGQSKFKH